MKRFYWCLGWALVILHIPIGLFLMVGSRWVPMDIWTAITAAIAVLQMAFLGCPLVPLAVYLRKQLYPQGEYYRGSLTAWLYARYGRMVALPIFTVLLICGIIVQAPRF